MGTESCDYKLAADLTASCENMSVSGIKNTGYILNYDDIDIDACVKDEDNANVLTSIVMKDGKHAYRMYVPGKTPFTGTNTALAEGTYRNKFTKTVSVIILNNGPGVIKDIINPLANGKFVVILENTFAGSDGRNTFQVYGYEQGLSATALADDKYSEDTDGGWSATLEESGAASAGIYLFNESVTVTRTALETLVSE